MSTDYNQTRAEPLWRRAWPICFLVIFMALVLVRFMPGGYGRAIVALPIALFVPGALTLGFLLGRRRLDVVAFGVLAVLLSVLLFCFASLILYALHVSITTTSTFLCLFVICAGLTAGAQRRVSASGIASPDMWVGYPVSSLDDDESGSFKAVGFTLAALIAGVLLLVGGTYSYMHGPHPESAGYTWIAWSGPQVTGTIEVGKSGTVLPFQIEHQEQTTEEYQLTATWTGGGAVHLLAKPITVQLGPGKSMDAELTMVAPPGGCTYRVVVTLTQLKELHPQNWSINADVRQRGARLNLCAR